MSLAPRSAVIWVSEPMKHWAALSTKERETSDPEHQPLSIVKLITSPTAQGKSNGPARSPRRIRPFLSNTRALSSTSTPTKYCRKASRYSLISVIGFTVDQSKDFGSKSQLAKTTSARNINNFILSQFATVWRVKLYANDCWTFLYQTEFIFGSALSQSFDKKKFLLDKMKEWKVMVNNDSKSSMLFIYYFLFAQKKALKLLLELFPLFWTVYGKLLSDFLLKLEILANLSSSPMAFNGEKL